MLKLIKAISTAISPMPKNTPPPADLDFDVFLRVVVFLPAGRLFVSGHLKGENERDNNSAAVDDAIKRASQVLPLNDDLQYISAVQVLKGMLVYGSSSNK